MCGMRSGNVFSDLIAEFACVNSGKKILPGTEQDRRNGQVHFVNETREKVLPDGRDSAAKPDVSIFCCVSGSFKRGMDSVGYEMEGSSSVHGDRRTRVVREHE